MMERKLLVLCIFVTIFGQIIILNVYRCVEYPHFRQKFEDIERYIFVDKINVSKFKKQIEFYQGMNETHKLRNFQNMEALRGINNGDQTGQNISRSTHKIKDRNVTKCSEYPKKFRGKETVCVNNETMTHLETTFKDVTNGGHWKPRSCKATKQIAIIVPLCREFRHFLIFLRNTIPKIKRQLIEFTMYTVESDLETECNVGLMRNIGFIEATKQRQYDCVIFNDVATFIENDRNLYTCHQGALLHMAVSEDNKQIHKSKIAGIQSFDSRVYQKINGNSNLLQSDHVDDDLNERLVKQDISIYRPAAEVATVTQLKRNQTTFVSSEKLKEIASFHQKDGLNSAYYEILMIERKQLFTRIVFKSNATYYQQLLSKYFEEDIEKITHSRFLQRSGNSTKQEKSGNEMTVKKRNSTEQTPNKEENLRENAETKTPQNSSTLIQLARWFLEILYDMIIWNKEPVFKKKSNPTGSHLKYKIAYNTCIIVEKHKDGNKTLQKTENQTKIFQCPFCSPFLEGWQLVQTKTNLSMKFLENYFSDVTGGHWSPKSCKARLRVAIIVPYRNRELHFRTLLLNLIPKLKRQQVDFTIYLVEQGLNSKFNRGLMRNIGFLIASKERDYDCYIFNDVDTITEDDRNLFTCIDGAALHIAVAVDVFGYQLKYSDLIGGILSIKGDDFNKTNGYSNLFFMWGGEDDSLHGRLKMANISILRPIQNISLTTTLRHQRDNITKERLKRVTDSKHFEKEDGLKSVKYKEMVIMKKKLYIWIYVIIDQNYYEQLIRYARTSSSYGDFVSRSKSLQAKLVEQGYTKDELKVYATCKMEKTYELYKE